MSEITKELLIKIQQKFPVMNVILKEDAMPTGTKVIRDIDGYNVTLFIGTYNVVVTEAVKIEPEEEE